MDEDVTDQTAGAPQSGPTYSGSTYSGGAPRISEADRLQDATITGIANVTALLRRVTESRRGGVSRESQLRHLAQWFAHLPGEHRFTPPRPRMLSPWRRTAGTQSARIR